MYLDNGGFVLFVSHLLYALIHFVFEYIVSSLYQSFSLHVVAFLISHLILCYCFFFLVLLFPSHLFLFYLKMYSMDSCVICPLPICHPVVLFSIFLPHPIQPLFLEIIFYSYLISILIHTFCPAYPSSILGKLAASWFVHSSIRLFV